MRWPTHQAAGLLVFEGVFAATRPAPLLAAGCLLAALAGSVAPDLDHLGALLRVRRFPGSSLGHRTLTHGLLGLVGAAWLGRLAHLPALVELAWVGAWAAHLVADLATPEGCPLLWPLGGRFSLRICRTGSRLETWLLRPALLVLAVAAAVGLTR